MKKRSKVVIVSAAAVSAVAVWGIMVNTQQPREEPEVSKVTIATSTETPEITLEPSPEPIVVPEPTATAIPSQTPVVSPDHPTKQTYIDKYGWSTSPNRESIDYIINTFPGKFDDQNMQESFAYIKRVADASGGITYIYIYLMQVQGKDDPTLWARLGSRVGI